MGVRSGRADALHHGAYVAILGLVVLVALPSAISVHSWRAPILVGATAVAVLGALRRDQWPYLLPAAAIIAAVSGVPAMLVPAMFSLGLRRRTPASILIIGVAVVVVAVFTDPGARFISIQNEGGGGSLDSVLNAGFTVVLPTILGQAVGARRELLASLKDRAQRAEQERAFRTREAVLLERARIAREAHDILGHRLSLLALQAGGLEVNAPAEPAFVRDQARLLGDTTRQALNDLRLVIGALHEGEEETHRVLQAREGLASIERLVHDARMSGATVDLTVQPPAGEGWGTLPESCERAAVRIVQEALSNAHRHAPHSPVDVRLRGGPGEGLELWITNPLERHDTDRDRWGSFSGGRGLVGLHERARLVGGQITTGSSDGDFTVEARLPWPTGGTT